MKPKIKYALIFAVVISLALSWSWFTACKQEPKAQTVQTRIGTLEFTHDFENGYPTDETINKLYDELDFQRACQAYLWGLPLVAIAEWQHAHESVFGAGDSDFVIYTTYKDKQGILTANVTTPYVFAFADLMRTGPLVLETQPGPNASGCLTFWQLAVMDIGAMGPDKNEGGKFLIIPPNSDIPDIEDYYMVRMPTQNVWLGARSLDPNLENSMEWIRSIKLYPYAEREDPPETKFIDAGDREWSHVQPRGMAYWERLADIINKEVVQEHDRVMMAMLKTLGIEKGEKFNPTSRQKKILEEAATVGEAMAKANTFDKRFDDVLYRPETHWKYVIVWDWTHETKHYHQLDELASYTYEAVGTSRGMATQTPGVGQAYLGAYKDGEGNWLDGSISYRLHVPPNPPMKQFWSVTVYDVDTRCPIDNEQQIADRSSRMDLIENDDGSVDIYFGPEAPVGNEKNWIPTVPGKGWFTYLRLYAPTEPYFERSWKLNDIEKVQ
jgi:hypothetical protein